MRKHYLPPVIEKNAKKGYKPPSRDVALALIMARLSVLVKRRGLVFKKPVETVKNILLIHYPVDIMCVENDCMAVDPVRKTTIRDHGAIGALALLLQHPSPTPYLETYIDIDTPMIKYTREMFSEEYSIPPLRTGPGRYYVPFIAALLTDSGQRVVLEPPMYYLVEFPVTKETFRVFEALRGFIEYIPFSETDIIRYMEQSPDYLVKPSTRKDIEDGLKKLYDMKVLTAGDTLYIMSTLKQ